MRRIQKISETYAGSECQKIYCLPCRDVYERSAVTNCSMKKQGSGLMQSSFGQKNWISAFPTADQEQAARSEG